MNKSSAPALSRGIELLRILEDGRPHTLQALASRTGWPKASLLRLLGTLSEQDLVSRNDIEKSYTARARLIPLGAQEEMFSQWLADGLRRLARESDYTAEWYIPSDSGMMIVQRMEPEIPVIRVVARVGFLRHWDGELEAVNTLAHAWRKDKPADMDGFWSYVKDGARKRLSAPETSRRLATALRTGWAWDAHYNTNGVRRMACVVLRRGRMAGVLALAAGYRPDADAERPIATQLLAATAQHLYGNDPFRITELPPTA